MLSCHNLWVSESDFIIKFCLSDNKIKKNNNKKFQNLNKCLKFFN